MDNVDNVDNVDRASCPGHGYGGRRWAHPPSISMPKMRTATWIRKKMAQRSLAFGVLVDVQKLCRELLEDVISGHGQNYSDYHMESIDRKVLIEDILKQTEDALQQIYAPPSCSSPAQRDTNTQLLNELQKSIAGDSVPNQLADIKKNLSALRTNAAFCCPHNNKLLKTIASSLKHIKS